MIRRKRLKPPTSIYYAELPFDSPAPLFEVGASVYSCGPSGPGEIPIDDFFRVDGREQTGQGRNTYCHRVTQTAKIYRWLGREKARSLVRKSVRRHRCNFRDERTRKQEHLGGRQRYVEPLSSARTPRGDDWWASEENQDRLADAAEPASDDLNEFRSMNDRQAPSGYRSQLPHVFTDESPTDRGCQGKTQAITP